MHQFQLPASHRTYSEIYSEQQTPEVRVILITENRHLSPVPPNLHNASGKLYFIYSTSPNYHKFHQHAELITTFLSAKD